LWCLSCSSSPAGYCFTSTDATAYNLPASLPLIPPLPLVTPWPPVPLVWLVVASPLLMPPPPICQCLRLSLHRRLSLRHGLLYLLSGWLLCCLRRSSSWRAPASQHAASTSHLPFAFCLPRLVVALLLVVPPLPPILLSRYRLSTRRLIKVTPLVAPPLQLVLLMCCCLSTHYLHLPLPFTSCLPWLVVASLLIAPPHSSSLRVAPSQPASWL
jgi:hypothetical protein